MLNATRITSGLYQGGAPASARAVLDAGFDALVLAAREVQPPEHALLGLPALRCPLVDDYLQPLSESDWIAATACARAVARRLGAGESVLVTCAQGRNRSGLISALVLILMGYRPEDAVRHIQRARAFALTNPRFVEALLSRGYALTKRYSGIG